MIRAKKHANLKKSVKISVLQVVDHLTLLCCLGSGKPSKCKKQLHRPHQCPVCLQQVSKTESKLKKQQSASAMPDVDH